MEKRWIPACFPSSWIPSTNKEMVGNKQSKLLHSNKNLRIDFGIFVKVLDIMVSGSFVPDTLLKVNL